jgi:sugar/nucleoside kinase (ribokinase family)
VADIFCGPIAGLPREGQLVAVNRIPITVGGCAANVAISLIRQGITVDVAGCVGDDPAAELIVAALASEGLGTDRIARLPDESSSKTVVVLIQGEDRRYLHSFGANARFSVEHLPREWIAALDVLYLGGLGVLPGMAVRDLATVLEFARTRGVTTVVDVVLPDRDADYSALLGLLPQIDYFLPNDDEGRLLTGREEPGDILAALREAGARSVILSLGERGALAFHEGVTYRSSVYPGECIDPSGAGDAFCAGAIAGIAEDWPMDRTLSYASALGHSCIESVGTTEGVFSREAAMEFTDSHRLQIARRS